jgi:phosphinothricin acetyltransferase
VETTVYVRPDAHRRGLGAGLMQALIERARAQGLHAMIAAVDAQNPASIRLHERLGFQIVGRMPEVGAKFGRWLDLVLLQLRLDQAASPPG